MEEFLNLFSFINKFIKFAALLLVAHLPRDQEGVFFILIQNICIRWVSLAKGFPKLKHIL